MVRKAIPVLLFFYLNDISQAQVVAIEEKLDKYDVRFRKVLRDNSRDILESFDAVAGDVPQRYLEVARTESKKVIAVKAADFNGNGDVVVTEVETPISTVEPKIIAPAPTDAAKETTPSPSAPPAPAPAPAPSAVQPPPVLTKP